MRIGDCRTVMKIIELGLLGECLTQDIKLEAYGKCKIKFYGKFHGNVLY